MRERHEQGGIEQNRRSSTTKRDWENAMAPSRTTTWPEARAWKLPSFNLTSVPQALLLPSLAWRGNSDCHCAHSRQLLGIDKNIRFPRRWPECARCRIRVTSSASSTVRLSESIPSLSTTTPMLPSFSLSLLLCVLQCVGPVDTIIIIYNKDTTQCLSFVKSSGSVEDAKSTVVVLRIRPWVGRNRDVDGTYPPSHPVKIPKI